MSQHSTRTAALQVAQQIEHTPTSLVDYHSQGRLLVIATLNQALPIISQLSKQLRCALLLPKDEMQLPLPIDTIPVCYGQVNAISGYLGHFTVLVQQGQQGQLFNAAQLFTDANNPINKTNETLDLILDLTNPPYSQRWDVLLPGYYAPTEELLPSILTQLSEMVGEFYKPLYFQYNAAICAHGNSGQSGCTRCLAVCPSLAIRSLGDKIAVDPYLCQGIGSCATACPTGAITYAYPMVKDSLTRLRKMLATFYAFGGKQAKILFYDDTLETTIQDLDAQLGEAWLPISIEEIGAVGMDIWLAGLAYGAKQIVLLARSTAPSAMFKETHTQWSYVKSLLNSMGYPENVVRILIYQNDAHLLTELAQGEVFPEISLATFAGLQEKRTIVRLAIDHLYSQATLKPPLVQLPEGAPFGEILVNQSTCTLCMACVSVCPMSALSDGVDKPQLNFTESACVQCSICVNSCPEQALSLAPRWVYDADIRNKTRTLYEELPVCCVGCGKPFTTQRMLRHMEDKLKNHWMFQGDAIKRLQLCEDCRVKALFTK